MSLHSLRPLFLLPMALAPLAAQTPDAWDQLLARQRFRPEDQGAYQLVTRGQEFEGTWRFDRQITLLRASGELSFMQLDDGQAKAFWARQRWSPGESRWALLGPNLEVAASGNAPFTVDSLLQTLRDAGWKPLAERRDAFLREHPDNGEAWQDLFTESLKVALAPGDPNTPSPGAGGKGGDAAGDKAGEPASAEPPPDAASDQARFGEVDRALRGLMEVNGWVDHFEFRIGLDESAKGFSASPLLQPSTTNMRTGVEAALKARPGDWRLWSAWTELAGPRDSPEALLASLDPAPRQPWPPLDAAEPVALAYRRIADWVGLERCAASAMVQALQPLVVQASDDGSALWHRASVAAAWGPYRVEALLHLGRKQDAMATLAECRTLSGRAWRRVQQAFGHISLGGDLEKVLNEEERRAIKEFLRQPGVQEAVAPAAAPPLRLAIQGKPYWEAEFMKLQKDGAFDAWKPGRDLVWNRLTDAEARAFHDRGEGGEARWMLVRGNDLLASGGELPALGTLTDLVRGQGLPYLAELDAFIKAHPEHLEARGQRIAEVLGRTQTLGLEHRLLADRSRLGAVAIFPKDWKADGELWAPAARKALPLIEGELRHWPASGELWSAWASWAALHPAHPRPGALLRTLAIWKNVEQSRNIMRAGPLPLEATGLVTAFLQSQKDWEGLADWCRALWDLGWREALPAYLKPMPGMKEIPPQIQRFILDMPFRRILQPYAEALRNLGRTEELRQLALEMDLLQPGLAKKLEATPDSRPGRPAR